MKPSAVSARHAAPPRSESAAFTRRRFLQAALAAGTLPWVAGCKTGGLLSAFSTPKSSRSPLSMVNHACIGTGGMGWGDLQNFMQHKKVRIAALCDVDAQHLERAAKLVPDARVYKDWRELLKAEGDRIDSVNVTVPDHMHFPIAWSALKERKHVYCQKPLCHDVAEVRKLTKAARGLVTQLGTQMASGVHDRTAVQWLREGRIGKVTRVYLCSNRPGAIRDYRLEGPRPTEVVPPPPHLEWDLWLGTAPVRPYAPNIYHPVKWRAWQDFGTGWSGDIGCHIFDAVWKGLNLQPPLSVSARVQQSWKESPPRRYDTWPQGNHITWVFPGNELIAGDRLVVEWFDGEFYPPDHIRRIYSADLKDYPPESAMVIGTEGSLLSTLGYPPQLFPEDKFSQVRRPTLPERNHYHHWIDAIVTGGKTESHFEQTGPMTEAILLGTVAVRVPDTELKWNHQAMRTNLPLANNLLSRTYRAGWRVAGF